MFLTSCKAVLGSLIFAPDCSVYLIWGLGSRRVWSFDRGCSILRRIWLNFMAQHFGLFSAFNIFHNFLDFQLFRPEYHWKDLISRNAHLVHQNWYRISCTLFFISILSHLWHDCPAIYVCHILWFVFPIEFIASMTVTYISYFVIIKIKTIMVRYDAIDIDERSQRFWIDTMSTGRID
jgi:hypothetical protein